MGILDKLRNLIKKPKQSAMPVASTFNNTDMDKTMPFITIHAITSLLSNQEVFNRFMHFEQNKDYFDGLTPEFIAESVKTYVDFMNDKGAKFDKKVLKRIQQIEKFLTKEQREHSPIFVQYQGIDKRALYNTAISVLSNPNRFNQFLECQRTRADLDGIPAHILSEYISSEIFNFTRRIASNNDMESRIDFLVDKQRNVNDYTYRMNPEFQINPDFERAVFAAIKPTNDAAEYALQLYNELNKRVKYNPSFFALDQDLTNQFAYDIYYKSIDKTTIEDNSLICKQWAELYAYFLEKSGFEAYVCGKGRHKNVKAYWGTTLIEADATNQTTAIDDPSRLTDLTRSKLGVRPAGFKAYEFYKDKMTTRNLSTIQLDYDIADFATNRGANDQLLEILNLIDDNRDLTGLLMDLNTPNNEVGTIMKKLGFISDMIKTAHLDNMDSVGYLNHLFHCTLTPAECKRAKNTNAFYQNLYSNDCNLVPIIAVNISQNLECPGPDDYLYLEFVQNVHEIRPISRDKLIEKVVSGEYIQGRGKHDQKVIPGLPEITDPQFIAQARAARVSRITNNNLYNTRNIQAPYTAEMGDESK